MNKTPNATEPSLLWDCFTNWSLTLENTTRQEAPVEKQKINK